MPTKCAIKFCISTDRNRSFFRPPKALRERWLEAIGDHLLENKLNTKSFKVCELHFGSNFLFGSKEVYKNGCGPSHIRSRQIIRLSRTAVPTIFPVEVQSELKGELEENGPDNEVQLESIIKFEEDDWENQPASSTNTTHTYGYKVCCVPGCNSKQPPGSGELRFHRFPLKDPDRVKQWVSICGDGFTADTVKLICTLHFEPSDYFGNNWKSGGLKPKAVPHRHHRTVINETVVVDTKEGIVSQSKSVLKATPVPSSTQIVKDDTKDGITIHEEPISTPTFTNTCRTCLSEESLKPISEVVYDCGAMSKLLKDYFGFEIGKETKFPTKICSSCTINIVQFEDFKAQVMKNNNYLKGILSVNEDVKVAPEDFAADCKFEIEDEPEDETFEISDDDDNLGLSDDNLGASDDNLEVSDDEFMNTLDMPESIEGDELMDLAKEVGSKPPDLLFFESEQKVNSCRVCLEKFGTGEELQEHMKMNHAVPVKGVQVEYVCDSCPQKFYTHHSLWLHLGRDHPLDGYQVRCKVCLKVFDDLIVLNDHVIKENHVYDRTITCSVCDTSFKSKSELLFHQKQTKHQQEVTTIRIECEVCNKMVLKKSFAAHLRHHNTEKTFECTVCSNKFRTERHLKQHEMIHTGERPYVCDICNKGYSKPWGLSHHRKEIHNIQPAEFKCEHCGKVLKYHALYLQHLKTHDMEYKPRKTRVETDEPKPFMCEICSKGYNSRPALFAHNRTHKPKPFLCNICGKEFGAKFQLEKHSLVHSNIKREMVQCEICNKKFAHKASLMNHIAVHKNDKPHKCTQCEKAFLSRSSLNEHMSTHTGVKPFSCEVCEKTFHSRQNFRVHQKSHTAIRPHVCDVCGRGFLLGTSLRRHKKLHTGERPFKCDMCDEAYITITNLKRHIKRKHQTEATNNTI